MHGLNLCAAGQGYCSRQSSILRAQCAARSRSIRREAANSGLSGRSERTPKQNIRTASVRTGCRCTGRMMVIICTHFRTGTRPSRSSLRKMANLPAARQCDRLLREYAGAGVNCSPVHRRITSFRFGKPDNLTAEFDGETHALTGIKSIYQAKSEHYLMTGDFTL